MAFSRERGESMPAPAVLTARMVGIGMNFAAASEPDAAIESTLVHASVIGTDGGDLRVLAVLTTWLGIHHAHVNADRLVRLVGDLQGARDGGPTLTRAYWSAIGSWLAKDRRFARLTMPEQERVDLLPTGTAFQLQRRGEDERFTGSALRVPKGTLRDRADDVLPPEILVGRHAGYRNRVLMGPSFRADVWTVLERTPDLSIADLARKAACSFATAWQVAQDFRLLRAPARPPGTAGGGEETARVPVLRIGPRNLF
jgi:hypothetical protein